MTHGADLDQRLMQCLSGFSADKVLFTCLSTLSSLEGGHYAQPTFRVGSNAPPPWGWSIHTLFGSLLHRFVSSPPLLMHSLIFFSVKQCTGPQSLWHQGLVLWKTVFPQMGKGMGDGFRMIQEHYIYCALYFYFYYISATSDYQAF